MSNLKARSVANIERPCVDPDYDSGLIQRCRKSWNTPIDELSNEMLATFLRQQIATMAILDEATKRLDINFDDGSELYEGELARAVDENRVRRINSSSK
jgi:hypothetical protein